MGKIYPHVRYGVGGDAEMSKIYPHMRYGVRARRENDML